MENPKKTRNSRDRFSRGEKSEFDQKIVDVRRVARVVAGGRRFSFRVTVVVGNRKGEVGVGLGKAGDTPGAIEKAVRLAKKNRIKVPLTKNNSITNDIEAKYTQARVIIKPIRQGRGLVAGSALRNVLDLAGINDVTGKILSRSKNKLNIARATICALKKLKPIEVKPKIAVKKEEKVNKVAKVEKVKKVEKKT